MQHHLGRCLRCYPYSGKALKHGPYLPTEMNSTSWFFTDMHAWNALLVCGTLILIRPSTTGLTYHWKEVLNLGPDPYPCLKCSTCVCVCVCVCVWVGGWVCERNFSSWFLTHIHAWNASTCVCVCERNFWSWFVTHIHAWNAVLLCVCVCVCVCVCMKGYMWLRWHICNDSRKPSIMAPNCFLQQRNLRTYQERKDQLCVRKCCRCYYYGYTTDTSSSPPPSSPIISLIKCGVASKDSCFCTWDKAVHNVIHDNHKTPPTYSQPKLLG